MGNSVGKNEGVIVGCVGREVGIRLGAFTPATPTNTNRFDVVEKMHVKNRYINIFIMFVCF